MKKPPKAEKKPQPRAINPKRGNTIYATSYDETYPAMLIKHLAQGYSFESFAGVIGVARRTIYNWVTPDDPAYQEAFKEAREIGEAKSRLFYEATLLNNLVHPSKTIVEIRGLMFAMQLRGFAPSPAGLSFKKAVDDDTSVKKPQTFIIGITEDDI
jgi:hypothetical protein